LLQDIAVNVEEPVSPDNPLRQVIVNTHSPAVVMQVPDDSLLVAELKETVRDGQRFNRLCFSCLPDTWRVNSPEKVDIVSKGKLLAYLNPVVSDPDNLSENGWAVPHSAKKDKPKVNRVRDRKDLQRLLFPQMSEEG